MADLVLQLLHGEALYAIVFALVVLAVAGLMFGMRGLAMTRDNPVERRLRQSLADDADQASVSSSSLAPEASRHSMLDAALRPLASVAKPTDEDELEGLRSRLAHGGYRSERALYVYLVTKLMLCLGGAAGVLWFNAHQALPLTADKLALYTVIAMIIGVYAPNLWLSGRVTERQSELSHSLPDALDLLVTCVEAGLGLDAALNRVGNEVKLSSPLLAAELSQTALEMRVGLSRSEAVRRLANRTGVDELKYLASIIVQTELFGTSIAKSLRVMADGMRVRRSQRAEERAAKVGVKMTLPLILCILPSLFAVLLGPAIINIIRIMLPQLGDGKTQ